MRGDEAAATQRMKTATMFSYEEALEAVMNNASFLGVETIDVSDCAGRILAEDILAEIDVPSNDVSCMDGYAVNSHDTLSAEHDAPVILEVSCHIAAGDNPDLILGKGEAARIFTGASLPEGADAVIPQEDVESRNGSITVGKKAAGTQFVRLRGGDICKGMKVLSRGRVLTSRDAGLLAGLSRATAHVGKAPRVGIITSGNELQSPGEQLAPGMIYDSNRYLLISRCKELHINYIAPDIVRDDYDLQKSVLMSIADSCDLIVTTGGTSVGKYDFIASLLRNEGELIFWNAKMKPGRPVVFGNLRGKPFFGLPGNPAAVMVGFELFVKPALMKMMGASEPDPPRIDALMDHDYIEKCGHTRFTKGIYTHGQGNVYVQVIDPRSSGLHPSLTEPNCLIVMDAGIDLFRKGDIVEIILLR